MKNSRLSVFSGRLSDDLLRAFGHKSDLVQEGVSRIYGLLIQGECTRADRSLAKWKALIAESCGRDPDKPSSHIDRLARSYRISTDRPRPAELLFALQAYYVLSVKLLVERTLGVSGALNLLEEESSVWRNIEVLPAVAETARRLTGRLDGFHATALKDELTGGRDLLGALYQDLFLRTVRHALGEYYTPDWLADHVLDAVGYDGDPEDRLLDPSCGSGTFLLGAIRRIIDRGSTSSSVTHRPGANDELAQRIISNVVGIDLNPLAVLSARANYLLALADLLTDVEAVRIPIFQRDSILADSGGSPVGEKRFDYVVGNPPWIAWDNLPDDYRRATMELWRRYGLFSLSGNEARHGGGKKDLSMLMLYAAADRYLQEHGRLGMVITQTLFQSKGAGDGFRRFRLGDDGPGLRVLRVDDMVRLKPFPGAANWTATVVLEKGPSTRYPVPYFKWSSSGASSPKGAPDNGGNSEKPADEHRFDRHHCLAQPIDPAKDTSPWFVYPEGLDLEPAQLTGPSDYVAHLGANSGGANGVYWLDILGRTAHGIRVRNIAESGKRRVDVVEAVIEPDLVYPLVRWSDVSRYRAQPSAHILLTQDTATRRGIDQDTMRDRYPKTLAYLERFAGLLTGRAAYRRYQQDAPFYSMYNVGPYTTAAVKVVWRRMDKRVNAAVLTECDDPVLGRRSVIPQETCVLIAADSLDEAHYLAAVLNSSVVEFLVTSHSVHGGKGFATPSMLDFIRLARFDCSDAVHAELAELGRRAHRQAAAHTDLSGRARVMRCGRVSLPDHASSGVVGRPRHNSGPPHNSTAETDLSHVQRQIDQAAGQLWDLDARQLETLLTGQ